MADGGESKTLLPLLLSPMISAWSPARGGGALGAGFGLPPGEQRKERERGRWEPQPRANYIFYKGTSHDLNPFVYLLLAYAHDLLDKMMELGNRFAGHAYKR
jgi:hypothetical protein